MQHRNGDGTFALAPFPEISLSRSARGVSRAARTKTGHDAAAAMDPEAFLDMANQVIKLKMFPYFDIAHSLLCALAVREDLGPGEATPPHPIPAITRRTTAMLRSITQRAKYKKAARFREAGKNVVRFIYRGESVSAGISVVTAGKVENNTFEKRREIFRDMFVVGDERKN